MGDDPFDDIQREPDADVLRWLKEKLLKLDTYEHYLWLDKEHLPIFADFIFSFVAKKLYCYMGRRDMQPCLLVTYNITAIKQVPMILYMVRDPGWLTVESVAQMVSIGVSKGSSGARLARTMSDVQTMVRRREVVPQIQCYKDTHMKPPLEKKKNALMPSLSEVRLPSRVSSRTPTTTLFSDTLRSNMASRSTMQSSTSKDEFHHPIQQMLAIPNIRGTNTAEKTSIHKSNNM